MRILICGSAYAPQLNGQAIFTRDLAEGMAARGHEVRVLAPSVPGHDRDAALNGVDIVRLPSLRLRIVNEDLHMPVRFLRIVEAQLAAFRPDVVHVQDLAPVCQALVRAARRHGIPVVATHHTGPEITAPYLTTANPIVRRVATAVGWEFVLQHLRHADLVTVPSRASAKMLKDKGLADNVLTVPCFVRLDDFAPRIDLDRDAVRRRYGLDPDSILLLYTGRIDIEKRVNVLIQAMAALTQPDVQLAIAGRGAQEEEMRGLADALGLGDRIRFLGNVNHAEIPALLQSADIFAMPGDVESFSIATLEAMACGKPVLATASPALSELIQHKTTGYLFQPKQAQDAAAGIRALIESRAEWAHMGAVSIEKAAGYDVDHVMLSYEHAYRRAGALLRDAQRPTSRVPVGLRIRRLLPRAALGLVSIAAVALASSALMNDRMPASQELGVDDLGAVNIMSVEALPDIAPHPGDEILGDDGLIQAVLEEGAKVRVVIVTNGEGQLDGPIVMGGNLRTGSVADDAKLGGERRKASLDAADASGTPESPTADESVVVLLGYPDGKLNLLWESRPTPDPEVRGEFTLGISRPPESRHISGGSLS